AHGFDVVPVGIEDERAVVVRVVVLANAGLAIVDTPGFDRGTIEVVHDGARLGGEGDVQSLRKPFSRRKPKVRLAAGAESDRRMVAAPELQHYAVAERGQCLEVEGFGTRIIGYRYAEVVDHDASIGPGLTRPSSANNLPRAQEKQSPVGDAHPP